MKIYFVYFIAISTLWANTCLENRAAFDIGSGTTKLKVATIDVCLNKIVKVLHESDRAVGYKQDLQESKLNTLSANIYNRGLIALKELKKEAQRFNSVSYYGVATSAFRTSLNGANVIARLAANSDISIRVITQKEEAMIGFIGASAYSDVDLKNIVVWDIGGGSMQITSYLGNNHYSVYEGKLASVSFKNHMIVDVKGMDLQLIKTPNPISQNEARLAQRDARVLAKITVPSDIKDKILQKETQVIGIGGVHGNSIAKKVKTGDFYSHESLRQTIGENLNLRDDQIGGNYASTDVSNLILVSGFMEALGISKVKVAKVNLADGILVNPAAIFP